MEWRSCSRTLFGGERIEGAKAKPQATKITITGTFPWRRYAGSWASYGGVDFLSSLQGSWTAGGIAVDA